MVSSRSLQLTLAFGLGLVMLVVSCAPAAAPTAAPTTAPPTATTAPGQPTLAPPTPAPTPVGGAPRRGGVLVIGGPTPGIGSFSSWENCCSAESVMVDDSVLEYIPSDKFAGGDDEIGPRMAYNWSVAKDGLSWTFKLEPNMKAALPADVGGGFEVVDCEDVAWSIMTIKTGEGLTRTMRGRTLVPVTGVDCPDPLTAVVKTKWPYAGLPGMLAVSINDVKPKGYWQPRLKELSKRVVGSGPWKLDSFIAQEASIWSPNPYYHRKAPDGKPYPYLDRIEWRDMTAAACGPALRTGRVHTCGFGAGQFNGGDLLYKEAQGTLTFRGPFRPEDNPEWGSKGVLGNDVIFLMAHHEKKPWNNVKMREALSLALDRRTLCDIGIEKWCEPGAFVFVVGTPWNLPRNETENYPGYNINTVDQNTAKARQILTELGVTLYPDPKAPVIDLPAWLYTGLYIQAPTVEMLRRAGFNPNFYIPEIQRILSQAVSGEFDVIAWDQAVSHNDPNQICYEHYYTGSDRNYGRYGNPKADALCDQLGQELDRTKRITLANQFAKFILDDHARATLMWRGSAYAYSKDVRGFVISSVGVGNSVFRGEKWWLAK